MNTIPVYVRSEDQGLDEASFAGDFEPQAVRTLVRYIQDEGYYVEDSEGKAYMAEGQLLSYNGRVVYDIVVVE